MKAESADKEKVKAESADKEKTKAESADKEKPKAESADKEKPKAESEKAATSHTSKIAVGMYDSIPRNCSIMFCQVLFDKNIFVEFVNEKV